jgi:H+/Cl- antiporter ClcA
LWTDLPRHLGHTSPPFYLVLGLPVVGALIVIAARRWLPGDGGHRPLQGFAGPSPPWTFGPGVAVAAFGTLAFGAVLGPEAPLIALGAVVGSALSVVVKLDQKSTAVLSTAGSMSAISALFDGPLVAGMLMVEAGIGMGAALIPVVLPGLVAAAIGYVLFIGLGSWGGLNSTGLTFPGLPAYHGTHVLDLVIAIGVGIAAAVCLAAIRRIGGWVEGLAAGPLRMPGLLVAGGLAVGLLAMTARWLGANSQDELFSGQAAVPALVNQSSIKVVLVLLIAKSLGYAISLGSGFRGGPIFPAIFTGVGLAAVTEHAFNRSPTFAVAVGTAAGMAAMTRLVLAPVLFAALLVGPAGVDAIPAAVLATSAAWVTTKALDQRAHHPPETADATPAAAPT